jgi:hypothetical protein
LRSPGPPRTAARRDHGSCERAAGHQITERPRVHRPNAAATLVRARMAHRVRNRHHRPVVIGLPRSTWTVSEARARPRKKAVALRRASPAWPSGPHTLLRRQGAAVTPCIAFWTSGNASFLHGGGRGWPLSGGGNTGGHLRSITSPRRRMRSGDTRRMRPPTDHRPRRKKGPHADIWAVGGGGGGGRAGVSRGPRWLRGAGGPPEAHRSMP